MRINLNKHHQSSFKERFGLGCEDTIKIDAEVHAQPKEVVPGRHQL